MDLDSNPCVPMDMFLGRGAQDEDVRVLRGACGAPVHVGIIICKVLLFALTHVIRQQCVALGDPPLFEELQQADG